jgi:hypothetical protein
MYTFHLGYEATLLHAGRIRSESLLTHLAHVFLLTLENTVHLYFYLYRIHQAFSLEVVTYRTALTALSLRDPDAQVRHELGFVVQIKRICFFFLGREHETINQQLSASYRYEVEAVVDRRCPRANVAVLWFSRV